MLPVAAPRFAMSRRGREVLVIACQGHRNLIRRDHENVPDPRLGSDHPQERIRFAAGRALRCSIMHGDQKPASVGTR